MGDREALLSNDNSSMSHYSNFTIMSEVRIILMGKTRTGKSATGNTILGRGVFHAEVSPVQVTSKSSKRSANQGGRMISVIDTPGFCVLSECVDLSVPGPHVFLLVINLGARYTAEDVNTVKLIQEIFGEGAISHTIVLFTHADQLRRKTLQQYVRESPNLLNLTNSCGGRYHAFNNENMTNRNQVNEMMKKIEEMVLEKGGGYYTNEMYKEAKKKRKVKERKKKAVDVVLGVGSAVGTGAAVAGGVFLGETVVLPAILLGAGAAALGMGVKHETKLNKTERNRISYS